MYVFIYLQNEEGKKKNHDKQKQTSASVFHTYTRHFAKQANKNKHEQKAKQNLQTSKPIVCL